MLEGSRAFDIAWGAITGSICFPIGIVLVRSWLAARRDGGISIFGEATDPGRGLHLAWAIFAMSMGGTNFGCRFINHLELAWVHEGFFAITLVVYAVLLPRLASRTLRTLRASGLEGLPSSHSA